MAKLLKDRYFLVSIALIVFLGIFIYVGETYFIGLLPAGEEWHLSYMALQHILFLAIVAIAAWRFGAKGGLATCFIAGLILLPHTLSEAEGHWRPDMLLDLGIIISIGIMFSWLISSRKRAEEGLKQTVAKLEHSNAELQQFAYVASHDLQEPLRMVASYVQLLKRRYQGKLDKDADEFIAYAVDGASRMQRMINDLLTYSRIGTRGKEFQPADGEAVFEQAVANLQMAIEETGATVTHDPLPAVMADESQLVQLFQNLISNAIRFHGQEPPLVHVSAEQKGKEWVFSVGDNGIGIDRQHLERVFIIFQRLHAQTEYPGTGIGLAICNKIVERHGGRIWVESEPGKGSIFYFTMPAKGIDKP